MIYGTEASSCLSASFDQLPCRSSVTNQQVLVESLLHTSAIPGTRNSAWNKNAVVPTLRV